MSTRSAHTPFTGFSMQGLDFFRRLAANNNKEWFEAHRGEFVSLLLTPLNALVNELADFMLSLDPHVRTEPSRIVSRINRDTRFTSNKLPYKTNLWFAFKRFTKDWQFHPCWFFELASDWYRYGMGYYSAPQATMDALRQELGLRPANFRKVIAPFIAAKEFAVEGELYSRRGTV